MSRETIAYLGIVVLVIGIALIVIHTRRFKHYERSRRHGQPPAKPVWKPFWLP